MKIKDILENKGTDVVSMSRSTNASKAALILSQQSIGAAVVVDTDGTLIGVLSERDIARGLGKHGEKIADMCIGDLMTDDVITCDLDWNASAALEIMLAHNFRHADPGLGRYRARTDTQGGKRNRLTGWRVKRPLFSGVVGQRGINDFALFWPACKAQTRLSP